MPSKHVKALRRTEQWLRLDAIGGTHEAVEAVEAAADHMEKLERQLRIARKALRAIYDCGDVPDEAYLDTSWHDHADLALAAMKKAGKK